MLEWMMKILTKTKMKRKTMNERRIHGGLC